MRKVLSCGVFFLLLAGCGLRDYPDDWPKPDPGWFARKGGCPDLVGDYASVNSELSWLLGPDPDFEVPQKAWREHHAAIEQAGDGSWLRITMNLDSSGLDDYRTRMLEFNLESNGSAQEKVLDLKRGEHYECSGGWLESLRFGQAEKVHGMQRKSLRLRKDRGGGLVAGATVEVDQSLGWGDSRGVALYGKDVTRWYRWPKRDPADEEALSSKQGVDLHRYSWVNHGTYVPVRFTSFFLTPICVKFYDGDYAIAVRGPERRRSRDDAGPPAPECPVSWGKFDLGEVFRKEMRIPAESPHRYRIEWFVLGAEDAIPQTIEISDVRKLPVMPESSKR
jgi:hypothetical protein